MEAESRINTILVGVDGSPESDRAAAFAMILAEQLDAEIVAAHAVDLLDVWPEHPEAAVAEVRHVLDQHRHQHVLRSMLGRGNGHLNVVVPFEAVAPADGAVVVDGGDRQPVVCGGRNSGRPARAHKHTAFDTSYSESDGIGFAVMGESNRQ